LALGLGFYDIGAGFALFLGLVVLSELGVLLREHPGQREKVVVGRETLFHCHQVHAQQVLAR
jgi:hypothetical protein